MPGPYASLFLWVVVFMVVVSSDWVLLLSFTQNPAFGKNFLVSWDGKQRRSDSLKYSLAFADTMVEVSTKSSIPCMLLQRQTPCWSRGKLQSTLIHQDAGRPLVPGIPLASGLWDEPFGNLWILFNIASLTFKGLHQPTTMAKWIGG